MAARPPPSIALRRFAEVIYTDVRRDAPDLTARQLAILLTVYLDGTYLSVKHLAEALRLSKPAVTRALDRLQLLNLIERQVAADRRMIYVRRTTAGYRWVGIIERDLVAAAAMFG